MFTQILPNLILKDEASLTITKEFSAHAIGLKISPIL